MSEVQYCLPEEALRVLRTTQIVILAMVSGILVTAGILWSIKGGELTGELSMLSTLGLAVACGKLVLSVVIPGLMGTRRDVTHVSQIWSGQVIVGAALLEGAAVLNLIAMMVDSCWYSPAAAGGLAVVMLLRFPTAAGLSAWLQLRQQDSSES